MKSNRDGRPNVQRKRQPKIIVLAHSKAWSSQIQRSFGHAKLYWVLDADALQEEASKHDAHVAIVEIPTATADRMCVQLAGLCNNSQNLKLYAVGRAEIYHWRKLLQIAGIAYSCWSTLQTPSLQRAVEQHLHTVGVGQQTLETIVESDLPWPTAANETSA